MQYEAIAESDIGTKKDTNQDSILIKHATYGDSEVLMTIICDGMGGLSKGEIASATVIREFDAWFTKELPHELKRIDLSVISGKWSLLLKTLNMRIQEYGKQNSERLGTTFTGTLFVNNQYMVVHVGDTRLYYINTLVEQITDDHTYVAQEVLRGTLTPEQAEKDKHRNILLQCVGASKTVEPQIICGKTRQGIYMLCSDGFRHKITEGEILDSFHPKILKNRRIMQEKSRQLIGLIKNRKEKDNISVILVKVKQEDKREKTNGLDILNKKFCKERNAYIYCVVLLFLSIAMFVCGWICM